MFCVGINKKMYKNSGKLHKCALNQYSIVYVTDSHRSYFHVLHKCLPPLLSINEFTHTHTVTNHNVYLSTSQTRQGKYIQLLLSSFHYPSFWITKFHVCVCIITFSSVSWIKFYLLSQLTQRKMSFYLILLLTMCV